MSDISFTRQPLSVAGSGISKKRRCRAEYMLHLPHSNGPAIYRLPNLILRRIFSLLALDCTVLSTLLVNTKFHDLSIPELYRNVCLRLDARSLQFFITLERYPDRTVHIFSLTQNASALKYWDSPEAFTSTSLPEECINSPYIEVITKLCADLVPKCCNLSSYSFADLNSSLPTIQTIKSLSKRVNLKSITLAGLLAHKKSELARYNKLASLGGLSHVTILGASRSQADLKAVAKGIYKFLKSQKQLTSLGLKYLNLSSDLIFNVSPWKSLTTLRLHHLRIEATTFDNFIRSSCSLRSLTALEILLDCNANPLGDGIFCSLARIKIWKKPLHLYLAYIPQNRLNLERISVSDSLSEAQFLELGQVLLSHKVTHLEVLDVMEDTTMTHKIARMISNLSSLQQLSLLCNLDLMGTNPETFAEIFSNLTFLETVDMGTRVPYSDQSIFKFARIYGSRILNLEQISIGAKRATILRDCSSGRITEIRIAKPTIFSDTETPHPV